MPRPTFASVTEAPCTCEYLKSSADDPDNPIVFDALTGEYQFTYQEPGHEGLSTLIIFHCPFCGGAAPASKRELLFSVIPRSEVQRLAEILRPISTLEDALQSFGAPDYDTFVGKNQHELLDQAPGIEHHRQLRYEKLSGVADAWITERPDGRATWRFRANASARICKPGSDRPDTFEIKKGDITG